MHAAAANPRVSGVVLINQRDYVWVEGNDQIPGGAVASEATYARSLRSMEKWKRVLTGETAIGPIVVGLMRRRLKQWHQQLAYVAGGLGGKESAKGIIRQKFLALQKRGVSVQIVFGEMDEGLEISNSFFGKNFAWLRKMNNVRTATEPSMDHALFLYPARDVMMDTVERQLAQQALAAVDNKAPNGVAPAKRKLARQSVLGATQQATVVKH